MKLNVILILRVSAVGFSEKFVSTSPREVNETLITETENLSWTLIIYVIINMFMFLDLRLIFQIEIVSAS